MGSKAVAPSLGAKSFTCPHCGATAHEYWFRVFLMSYDKDAAPFIPTAEVIDKIRKDHDFEDQEGKNSLLEFFTRKAKRGLFTDRHEQSKYLNTELINLSIGRCYSCDEYTVWVADNLIYPAHPTEIQPNEEMPTDIRQDFSEAASILDQSPRGAAALLRLCVQKLMIHLDLKGKKIDEDIGELVKKGLDPRIQKALDVVRVIGNNAVHPGQIDLSDDKATAIKLFNLVNLIIEAMIVTPKHVDAMFEDLPPSALKAIEKRDGKKSE